MASDVYSSTFSNYSGSQISIYFGNILLDDIYSIQWTRTQNKMPIYGYASRNFDAVANGTVLIQGNFVINFRQQGYMSYIMKTIQSLYAAYNPLGTSSTEAWSVAQNLIAQHLNNGTFGPQSAADIMNLGNSNNFFQLASAYENAVWGANSTTGEVIYPADVEQANDNPTGFNILIQYGQQLLDDNSATLSQYMNSTKKSLNGVHLVGESQMIQVGGQPVQEQYSFIANDTDTTV